MYLTKHSSVCVVNFILIFFVQAHLLESDYLVQSVWQTSKEEIVKVESTDKPSFDIKSIERVVLAGIIATSGLAIIEILRNRNNR